MKPLPLTDFRAVRIVLEPKDFALVTCKRDPPPADLIGKEDWQQLVGLPDDVSIRTSNTYGGILHDLIELHSLFLEIVSPLDNLSSASPSPMAHVILEACGEFDASMYNALTGYYRIALSALRNIVEQVTIGAHLELSNDVATFQAWLAGNEELKFGEIADILPQNVSVQTLESALRATINDDLFRQRKTFGASDPGGFARRIFSLLCKYTHGAPGYTDADIWESNGPIFVSSAFITWGVTFLQVMAFSILMARMSQPRLVSLEYSSEAVSDLFAQVSGMLRSDDDGKLIFDNVPAAFW